MISSNSNSTSGNRNYITQPSTSWSQMNKNKCFLEDLEENGSEDKENFENKIGLEKGNQANKVTQNNATMTENSITRSTISASTPNIFSLSTSSTPKRDLSSFKDGDPVKGIKLFLVMYHFPIVTN